MAVPTWPAELPQKPLVGSYRETWPDNRLRSPMSDGPPKVRLVANNVRPFSLAFAMSASQLTTFWNFFNDDLAQGSSLFTIPARPGGTWLVQFGEAMPDVTELGRNGWRVTLQLENLP